MSRISPRSSAALPADVPVTVLGVGSNLLVRDGGIKGVVIRLMRGFTGVAVEGNERAWPAPARPTSTSR